MSRGRRSADAACVPGPLFLSGRPRLANVGGFSGGAREKTGTEQQYVSDGAGARNALNLSFLFFALPARRSARRRAGEGRTSVPLPIPFGRVLDHCASSAREQRRGSRPHKARSIATGLRQSPIS